MPCTTLLTGRLATYDGSTMIARNEDSKDISIHVMPDFYDTDSEHISLDSLYWMSRIIAAMADADFHQANPLIMQYQEKCLETGHRIIS